MELAAQFEAFGVFVGTQPAHDLDQTDQLSTSAADLWQGDSVLVPPVVRAAEHLLPDVSITSGEVNDCIMHMKHTKLLALTGSI